MAATCAAEVAGLPAYEELRWVNPNSFIERSQAEDPHESLFWRFWGELAFE